MNLDGLVTARIDLGIFRRVQLALHRPDLREAWRASKKPLLADQREHAKRQEGPGGAWAPRSSATKVRAASGRRRRTRKLLGRLPTANKTTIERLRMIMASPVKWSAIHQDGGRAGHGARIPARPFRWASDRVLETISGIVAKGIAYLIEAS